MRRPVVLSLPLLVTMFGTATPGLHAQQVSAAFPAWTPSALAPLGFPVPPLGEASTRSHTGTGLLIGGLVGVAATTVFLVAFCGDPDTACQGDEVARAVLVIAVPCAAAGAIIGSLIRTEE